MANTLVNTAHELAQSVLTLSSPLVAIPQLGTALLTEFLQSSAGR